VSPIHASPVYASLFLGPKLSTKRFPSALWPPIMESVT